MKIYLAKTTTLEQLEGFDYSYITITKELAQTVLRRRKVFLDAQKTDGMLERHQYRDYTVSYLPYSEALDDAVSGYDPEPAPKDFVLEEEKAERTECELMCIADYGVRWLCVPKYVDGVTVETVNFPYSIFENEL